MKIRLASVDRDGLHKAMAEMQELLKTMRNIRCQDQEKEDFTWIEAVADCILGELVPDETYRIVLEYKPEFNKVHISKEKDYDRNEKELFPWDTEEQQGH